MLFCFVYNKILDFNLRFCFYYFKPISTHQMSFFEITFEENIFLVIFLQRLNKKYLNSI
jgi:hypothetical protein